MSRAVSNRFKPDNNDFIRLESDWTYFRLLLETAPDGTSQTAKYRDKGLSDIRQATSRYE